MRAPSRIALGVLALCLASATQAAPVSKVAPKSDVATSFKSHVGTAEVQRLLRHADAHERIRGLERARALGTPEAVALVLAEFNRPGFLTTDGRVLLAAVRALAPFTHMQDARNCMLAVVKRKREASAFHELAQQQATLALARSGDAQALAELGDAPALEDARVAPTEAPTDDDTGAAYLEMDALARSSAPNAGALIASRLGTPLHNLAARAYVVRALERGERRSETEKAVFALASSQAPAERALGVFARVVLGDLDARAFFADREPRVRRAAIMASLASRSFSDLEGPLLDGFLRDPDPVTRQVFALGLLGGDPRGLVTTATLADRFASGAPDAPLAAFLFAARAEASNADALRSLLTSREPILRAHAARGLARAPLSDATGKLADLYAWETDASVRRAAILALAARTEDARAPARRETLELAAALDPDREARGVATRALANAPLPKHEPLGKHVAWLRRTAVDRSAPGELFVGVLVRADGLAVPVAFDDEGFALAVGLPKGEARLVPASRFPAYSPKK